MSKDKDDFDLFPHLSKPPKPITAVDFVRGLQCREAGNAKSGHISIENLELYAEERLVHKEELNEMRCEMPGLPRSTFLMVFSPDGRRVASTHGNHNIYVTDLRSGKNIKTLIGHPRTPWCIAFHPTSDQIVASGCLGGQVRIWDLSGGSEVWTTSTQSVIASIAFHPNDRILVIATINEVYFWDWSQPEPFIQTATNNPKEKVRYVAFDKLGHKLITGIANSPQTRWERVRAPVLVPRQERCASPYRRTITQRLVLSPGNNSNQSSPSENNAATPPPERDTSSVPERERRITMCYRNLVREYERLVHRYLQLCRSPIMIDRGTDPMEPSHLTSGTQTASNSDDLSQPGPSGLQNSSQPSFSNTPTSNQEPQPSTSHSQNLITPSRIFSIPQRPPSSIRGTQTSSESRKHKSDSSAANNNEKRFKRNASSVLSSEGSSSSRESSPQVPGWSESNNGQAEASNSNTDDQRVLVVNLERLSPESLPTNLPEEATNDRSILDRSLIDDLPGLPTDDLNNMYPTYPSTSTSEGSTIRTLPGIQYDNVRPPGHPSTSGSPGNRYSQRFDEYIRANRERIMEFRRRHHAVLSTEGSSDLTSSQEHSEVEAPSSSRESLLRNESNSQSTAGEQRNIEDLLSNIRRTAEEEVRNRILPIIRSVPPPDRPELIRLFENSRVHVRMRVRQMCPVFLRRHCRRTLRIDSSTDSSSSDNDGTRQSPTRLSRRNSAAHVGNPQSAGDFVVADSPASPPFSPPSTAVPSTLTTAPSTLAERNYRAELDQLVASLLSEMEWNEETSRSGVTPSPSLSTTATSARTRPTRNPLWPNPPGESIENLLRETNSSGNPSRRNSSTSRSPWSLYLPYYYTRSTYSGESGPNAFPTTDTRTTNSTIYTSSNSSPPNRRRGFSHRLSAFMPTRVNYTRSRFRRSPHWSTGRTSNLNRGHRNTGIVLDELINFAERENSEGNPTPGLTSYGSVDTISPSYLDHAQYNSAIVSTYSRIMHNLEVSLNDVRNLNPSGPHDQTSSVLNSFASRMALIVTYSDTILTILRITLHILPTTSVNDGNNRADAGDAEPRWNFSDPAFYVRDLRTDTSGEVEGSPTRDRDLLNSLNAATADHTYPRNPNNTEANVSSCPLINSLHLAVSHIQRQARLLRRQVEIVERVNWAVAEVTQLQLMRQLVIEMVKYVRHLEGNGRAPRVSSVRQMMAGTRISDSSPYESPSEEPGPSGLQNRTEPQPSTSTTAPSDQPGPSTATPSHSRRNSSRKTYPPSRLHRLPRQRRPTLVHWFAKRCISGLQRVLRPSAPPRTASTRPTMTTSTASFDSQVFNRREGDETALGAMSRKLERILTEQMRNYTRSQNMPSTATPSSQFSMFNLGEHILSSRLHDCVQRINRLIGTSISLRPSIVLRTSNQRNNEVPSQEDTSRHVARHTLSMIIDSISRYIGDMGVSPSRISNEARSQVHGVFIMSLLLSELLVLQVVDSMPSQSELNIQSEREVMTRRIDELCSQMLQNRILGSSAQLTPSLRLMRQTMRHAHRALDETYEARRNTMLPWQDTDRRQLLGIINRCLRNMNRRENRRESGNPTSSTTTEPDATRPSNATEMETYSDSYYSTIADLLPRLSDNPSGEIDGTSQPSTSQNSSEIPTPLSNRDAISSISNTRSLLFDFPPRNAPRDSERGNAGSTLRSDSNPARTTNESSPSSNLRPINVPSVHVNDVPVSEPSSFTQRVMVQRQRLVEQVSELRSNPRVGLFRPRFLHPLYASVNPFDADLDDPQREQIYDSDMVTTVTPNHRIQAWDISNWSVPAISNSMKNVVVGECKIHNDASVDIANDGTILVTLLPSGGYLNVTNRLGVYSLRWETLGQCLYTTSFDQNAVSVSLSPLSRHLVVGFVSRRVSIIPSDRWVMARIYKIEQKDVPGDRLPVLRELEREHRENRINCIRWLPTSGQGLIYATNTGQLVVLS